MDLMRDCFGSFQMVNSIVDASNVTFRASAIIRPERKCVESFKAIKKLASLKLFL